MLSKQEILTVFDSIKKETIPDLEKAKAEGIQFDEWTDDGYGMNMGWIDNELFLSQKLVLKVFPEYISYKFNIGHQTTEEAIKFLQNTNEEFVRLVFRFMNLLDLFLDL
jgi:hypothetical protein